jgi:hypothetical protein
MVVNPLQLGVSALRNRRVEGAEEYTQRSLDGFLAIEMRAGWPRSHKSEARKDARGPQAGMPALLI